MQSQKLLGEINLNKQKDMLFKKNLSTKTYKNKSCSITAKIIIMITNMHIYQDHVILLDYRSSGFIKY